MKTIVAAALVSVVAVSPVAIAHAENPGSYTITLNGQQVGQGNNAGCETLSGGYSLVLHLPKGTPSQLGAVPWTASAQLRTSDYRVMDLTIVKHNGTPPNETNALWSDDHGGGDIARPPVTKSGNTYKVTGTASNPTAHQMNVPYEVDATCP